MPARTYAIMRNAKQINVLSLPIKRIDIEPIVMSKLLSANFIHTNRTINPTMCIGGMLDAFAIGCPSSGSAESIKIPVRCPNDGY